MNESPPTRRRSVLDSPWYWVYLFSAAALAALFLAGPRYAARQAQLERNYQSRQRAMQHRVGETPSTPLSSENQTTIPLWPLFSLLSVLLLLAWWQLWRSKVARRATVARETVPPQNASPESGQLETASPTNAPQDTTGQRPSSRDRSPEASDNHDPLRRPGGPDDVVL
jgi:hypothetical protein